MRQNGNTRGCVQVKIRAGGLWPLFLRVLLCITAFSSGTKSHRNRRQGKERQTEDHFWSLAKEEALPDTPAPSHLCGLLTDRGPFVLVVYSRSVYDRYDGSTSRVPCAKGHGMLRSSTPTKPSATPRKSFPNAGNRFHYAMCLMSFSLDTGSRLSHRNVPRHAVHDGGRRYDRYLVPLFNLPLLLARLDVFFGLTSRSWYNCTSVSTYLATLYLREPKDQRLVKIAE